MKNLTSSDVEHLGTGAKFLTCQVDPAAIRMYQDMIQQELLTTPLQLITTGDLDPGDLVVSVGFVTEGLTIADMPPVGDEFLGCVRAIEAKVGRSVRAVYSLAASNVNGLVPLLVGLQARIPVIDADPMGRVFPLISQTTLNLGNVSISPIALMGVTGEKAILEVQDPLRADTLVRSLVIELGGWAATATYPCTAAELGEHGIQGSITRMMRIGEILDADDSYEKKYLQLAELLRATRITRARVGLTESFSRENELGLPTQTTGITLVDETTGQIVRLEVQNEILLVLVDGAVAAAVPDTITLIDPEFGDVLDLDAVREGQVIDVIMTPAAPQWYSSAGLKLAGPAAFDLPIVHPRRHG